LHSDGRRHSAKHKRFGTANWNPIQRSPGRRGGQEGALLIA